MNIAHYFYSFQDQYQRHSLIEDVLKLPPARKALHAKHIHRLLFLFLLMCVTNKLFGQFSGGDGTLQNPWQIIHSRQLSDISLYPNNHFILMADINLDVSPYTDGEGWIPIADSDPNQGFKGSFDGNGYTIHGLYINRPNAPHQGLFASGWECKIKNVTIIGANITGASFTGILAGKILEPLQLENCYVEGIVNASGSYSGLLTGELSGNSAANLENLHAEGTINSSASICGGLIGKFKGWQLDLYDSTANAFVYATGDKVGGLIGWNDYSTDLYRCVAYGVVQGNDMVGGLIGSNDISGWLWYCASKNLVTGHSMVGGMIGFNGDESIIRNSYTRSTVLGESIVGGFTGVTISNSMHQKCYSAGFVNGSSYVGGFSGWDPNVGKVGIFHYCYWDSQLSGVIETGGGVGRSTIDMIAGISPTTFVDWDFTEIWQTDSQWINDGYPTLRQTPVSTSEPTTPPALDIFTAYPNPFKESINISYEVKTDKPICIKIYNLKGQIIRTISFGKNETLANWDGRDEAGRKCPNATYVIRIQTEKKSISKRICLVR